MLRGAGWWGCWILILLLLPTVTATGSHHRRIRRVARYLKDGNRTTSRIVGGSNANPKRYPYFTLLDIVTSNNAVYQCGGILITPDMILTARHCTHDIGFVTHIIAHVNSTEAAGTNRYEYDRSVSGPIHHLKYNWVPMRQSVMRLGLVRRIHPFISNLRLVPLPVVSDPLLEIHLMS